MYKNNLKIKYIGYHPFEGLIKEHLILNRCVFVDEEEHADLILMGGNTRERPTMANIPKLLLSSHEIFKGTKLSDQVREDDMMALHPHADFAPNALQYLLSENDLLKDFQSTTLIVRTFPVYGHPVLENFLTRTIHKATNEEEPMSLTYGHRIRSYLHLEDFFQALQLFIMRALGGSTGIYNLGSPEQHSLQNILKYVYQLFHVEASHFIEEPWTQRPWRPMVLVPDITRTKALLRWSPNIPLRTGLTELAKTK